MRPVGGADETSVSFRKNWSAWAQAKSKGGKCRKGLKVSQKMAYLWCLIPVVHLRLQELKKVCSAFGPTNEGN